MTVERGTALVIIAGFFQAFLGLYDRYDVDLCQYGFDERCKISCHRLSCVAYSTTSNGQAQVYYASERTRLRVCVEPVCFAQWKACCSACKILGQACLSLPFFDSALLLRRFLVFLSWLDVARYHVIA